MKVARIVILYHDDLNCYWYHDSFVTSLLLNSYTLLLLQVHALHTGDPHDYRFTFSK